MRKCTRVAGTVATTTDSTGSADPISEDEGSVFPVGAVFHAGFSSTANASSLPVSHVDT